MRASVDIKAPKERVWSIVTDVERYGEWNPFFTEGHGIITKGSSLALTMKPVGQSTKTFSPKVLEAAPGERLIWQGRLFMPGLFDGTHRFIIERLDSERVRLTQYEQFSGIFVPFVAFGPYLAGWEEMNAALKRRAETPSPGAMSTRPAATHASTRGPDPVSRPAPLAGDLSAR